MTIDPRNQERYCNISFFDGWERVLIEDEMDYVQQTPQKKKLPKRLATNKSEKMERASSRIPL